MTKRFEKAQHLLKKHKANFVLITDSISARYFSGFFSSNVALLYSENEKFLFTDFRYKTIAQDFCKANNWTFVLAKQSEFAAKINEKIKKKSKILFQENHLSVAEFDFYKKNLKNVDKFISAGKEIEEIFYEKDEFEINLIKQAAKIADISFAKFQKELKTGMSEFEAAKMLEIICLQNGSEKTAFDTIVLFGENSAFPHGVPSRKRILKSGDFILCDFGCVADGFCSDMTRTICFGKANPEHKKIYDLVLEAQKIGVESVKVGEIAKNIDKKVRDFIKNAGFGENFGHGTGHSVGLRIHENPAVNSKNETILQAGMVITIEPGIYVENFVGVRIEDMIVVGENACEIITKTDKNFKEIL
jgi:Xaa-Pro aminopeptidase